MERGSSKHGPMLDDELKHETEAMERGAPVSPRVEEHRDPEAAADDERGSDARLTTEPAEMRSMIARSLHRFTFPGGRAALVKDAEETNAPDAVIRALRSLPADGEFHNVQDVWIALGGEREERF